MKILVTGLGYITQNLLQVLDNLGHTITVVSRNKKIENRTLKNTIYIKCDYSEILSNINSFDIVIHTASTSVPSTSMINIKADIEQNLLKSAIFFEKVYESGVKKIILLSSGGAIYGDMLEESFHENSDKNPISSYGITKIALENYLRILSLKYGGQSISLRISNPYGGLFISGKPSGFINTLINCAYNDLPFTLYGDGEVSKDFIYIDDLNDAIIKSIHYDAKKNNIFNIGSGYSYRLNEIIEIFKKNHPNLTIKKGVNLDYDVKKISLKIDKAKNELSWFPRTNVIDYILKI